LYQLFCLSAIEADLGTFRDGDFISWEQGEFIKKSILKLCSQLKKHIIPFVESFYPGDELLDSMLAPSDGDLYGSIINKIYTAPKAFERISNWRTLYK
jgi:hypothetical protein